MFNSYLNNNCAHCKCILCGWNPHGVKSRQVLMWVNAFMWVVTSAKEEEVRLAWFVCLFVSMIAHKVLYRFAWKCNQRCGSRQFSQSTSESKNSWQDYLRLRVKTKLNIISPQIHKTFEEIWRHYFDFQVNITNSFNSRYLGFRDSRHTWCRWNFSRGAQCGNFSSYRISTDKNEWALLSCS